MVERARDLMLHGVTWVHIPRHASPCRAESLGGDPLSERARGAGGGDGTWAFGMIHSADASPQGPHLHLQLYWQASRSTDEHQRERDGSVTIDRALSPSPL
jgi:hypothetical protein